MIVYVSFKMATLMNTLIYGRTIIAAVLFIFVANTDSQITEVCGAPGYDLSNLTARIWTFTLQDSPQACLQESNTTGDSCRFFMAFCRKLDKLMLFACDGASVCQDNLQDQTKAWNIGSYENNPFKVDTEYNPKGFIVDFPHGGSYKFENGSICTLSVRLDFVCQPETFWELPATASEHGQVPTPVPVLFSDSTCQFEILMNYAGACFTETPLAVTVLSVGSILLIIFFSTLAVYCLFGTGFKCINGSRGKDAMPNNDLWGELPVYVSDGILFVFKGCKRTEKAYDDI